jgi:hypothetical protein
MRRLLACCGVLLLLVGLIGCGSDRDRGVNKDKDRPKLEEKK